MCETRWEWGLKNLSARPHMVSINMGKAYKTHLLGEKKNIMKLWRAARSSGKSFFYERKWKSSFHSMFISVDANYRAVKSIYPR